MPLPELAELEEGLRALLGDLAVETREPHARESTSPAEVVVCVRAGAELRLFCKYESPREDGHGQRRGVRYEAEVYRRVLAAAPVTSARCHGSYRRADGSAACLVLEELDARRVATTDALVAAASWLGSFHRQVVPVDELVRYDDDYYRGWARRTAAFAGGSFPWLERLCRRFEGRVDVLTGAPQTVVHGEFYPANVLISNGAVYPVDWESAAVAPGEIDLATLTHEWDAETVRQCEAAYRAARAPAHDSEHVLALARVYTELRWLGDRADWTAKRIARDSLRTLRALGEQLDLL